MTSWNPIRPSHLRAAAQRGFFLFYLILVFCSNADAIDINRYVAGGVPLPDKRWAAADYQQAATVLAKETLTLPLLSDPEGAAVFERIVAEENLRPFQDKEIALQSKLPAYIGIQENINSILKLYLSAFNEGRIKSSTELTRLMTFMLHFGSVGIALIKDFIPTIPKDDKYEIRMAGLQKMKAGMTKMFDVLEQSLGEKNVYSAADLSTLLVAMKREMPIYEPMFENGYAKTLSEKLKKHLQSFPLPADQETLRSMITELDAPPVPNEQKT